MTHPSSRTALRRLAPSLIALLLSCTALAAPAHAGWLFGGDDEDAKKPAEAPKAAAPVQPATDIEGNVRQARLLRLAGNYQEAIHHLSQLMLVASDDGRVVGEYGKTLAQMGRAQDAVQFLTRAQQLSSGDWTIYSALGVAYDELGDQSQARIAYEHALTLKPGEPSVLNNLALSRLLAHDPDGARKLAEQARAAGGEADPVIRRTLAMIEEMAPAPAPVAAATHAAPVTPVAVAPEPQKVTASAEPAKTETVNTEPARAKPAPQASTNPVPDTVAPATVAQKTASDTTSATAVNDGTAYAMSGTDPSRPVVTIPEAVERSVVATGAIAPPTPLQPRGLAMQKMPADPVAGPVAHKTDHPRNEVAEAPADHAPVQPKPVKAAAAKPEPKKPEPVKAAAAKPEPKKPEPVKAATAKPEPKKPEPVKAASSEDTVPSLRLSANAY